MTLPARCPHAYEFAAPGSLVCRVCGEPPTLWVPNDDGTPDVMYHADPHQAPYHRSTVPNLIMVGPRGTGKSLTIRMDMHMRAMLVPGFKYLIMRRTMKDLQRSHLVDVPSEMKKLGGYFHHTLHQAKYPNGSIGWYGFADTEEDVLNYLSSQYDAVAADEVTTFYKELVLKMLSCVRVPVNSGRLGLFRGGTNKFGPGAAFVKQYFFDKNVTFEEDEDYDPNDWGVIEHQWGDNQHIDLKQYRKRLTGLQAHVRRAWIDNEWSLEGMYFDEFMPNKDGQPWHVIDHIPTVRLHGETVSLLEAPFVRIYRSIDWGFYPDPAVCLWIAVLPNKRALVFKERTWKRTIAESVARQIRAESEGLRVAETFCDPTMLINDGNGYTIAETFEREGVPLTGATNKRELYGYSVHDYLSAEVDGQPKLQLLSAQGRMGCPHLIRTFPLQVVDDRDPNRLGDGEDHYVIALAYFCMSDASPQATLTASPQVKRWMRPRWAATWDRMRNLHA